MMTISREVMRWTLIGLEVFTFIMAVYGSLSMLLDATGFGLKEEWLHGSPFTDYRIPALGLLVGVGGSSFLAASALVWARRPWGAILSIVAGVILVVFEIVETYSIGMRSFQQPLMGVFGLFMAGMGLVLWDWRNKAGRFHAERQHLKSGDAVRMG